jgi:hypothetical protein
MCSSRWCNGNYKYISSSNSYEVEHIIDINHSELNNCNKNIYGKWNKQANQLIYHATIMTIIIIITILQLIIQLHYLLLLFLYHVFL